MQRLWSLYNKDEKLRIDDLKPDQVKIILLAIPTAKMEGWFACQEGDLHWQSIAAIPEFYEDVRQIKGLEAAPIKIAAGAEPSISSPVRPTAATNPPANKPTPNRRPLFEDAPDENATGSLMLENVSTRERRSARRFVRQLNFHMRVGDHEFNCLTLDVSMSGISLSEPLPSWAAKTFRAELELNGQKVKVHCAMVSKTQVKFQDSESWHIIRSWIVNG